MLATWSYKERDTIIQRLDPRSRVIFMIATMFATIPIWDLREDVIDAMNLHAFGTGPRTWRQELRYSGRDYAVITLAVGMLLGAIAPRLGGMGGLWVPEWLLALAS